VSVEVAYRFDGAPSAPVLMLSNSLGTAMSMWEDQMPELVKHFRVLRYDQRGHGETSAPPGPYTIEDLGGDALDLLDRLDLEQVGFIGASMGGMTGMWMAINAPERIEKLALCCTSANIPPPQRWLERAALVRAKGMKAVAEASLERWFTQALRDRRSDVVAQLERDLLAIEPEGYAGCCEALADTDLRAGLGEIEAPTLVITGEDDLSTPPDHGGFIAEQVQRGTCLKLSPARHLANVERPGDVNRAVLDHMLAAEVR
jgi:3-oxoadipate enol-lactonase